MLSRGAYALIALLSCATLISGWFVYSSRRRDDQEACESTLYWQFKKLGVLALNLNNGTEFIHEAVQTVVAAAEKLQYETSCVKESIEKLPEHRQGQLLAELLHVERSCDMLIREARNLEERTARD